MSCDSTIDTNLFKLTAVRRFRPSLYPLLVNTTQSHRQDCYK